ncbi:MAG: hypothetical protein NVS3B26_18090 [Mycobacteriales bacterium]
MENRSCLGIKSNTQKGTRQVRVCHGFEAVSDDPNLGSCAGLAPVLQLAERAGLHELLGQHVRMAKPGGANGRLKIPALVGGMVAGADSIEDMDVFRHGGMSRLVERVRAPSTGSVLAQLHLRPRPAARRGHLVADEPVRTGPAAARRGRAGVLDVDDTLRQTYGYAKQGAGRGYTGVKGLNALLATVSTPTSAPVIAAARLRQGSTNRATGAARFVPDALSTAPKAGATGVLVCCGRTRPTTATA